MGRGGITVDHPVTILRRHGHLGFLPELRPEKGDPQDAHAGVDIALRAPFQSVVSDGGVLQLEGIGPSPGRADDHIRATVAGQRGDFAFHLRGTPAAAEFGMEQPFGLAVAGGLAAPPGACDGRLVGEVRQADAAFPEDHGLPAVRADVFGTLLGRVGIDASPFALRNQHRFPLSVRAGSTS